MQFSGTLASLFSSALQELEELLVTEVGCFRSHPALGPQDVVQKELPLQRNGPSHAPGGGQQEPCTQQH